MSAIPPTTPRAASSFAAKQSDLSEGFMLYSGFIGPDSTTPKSSAKRRETLVAPAFVPSARASPTLERPASTDTLASEQKGRVNPIGISDDLDELSYGYALKVAYITIQLQQAITQRRSKSITNGLASPVAIQTPTSATSSYFPANPRTNSVSGKSIFGKKKVGEAAKLPKDLVVLLWDAIGNEGGDAVWRTSVNTFLSYLPTKKATKTSSGLNLREIPVLLETFSSVLPNVAGGIATPQTPNSSSGNPHKHIHITHFVAVIQSVLEAFYNPMNKKLKEDDKETYTRIRNELDLYSLRPGLAPRKSVAQGGGSNPTTPEPGYESPNARSVSRKSSFLSSMSTSGRVASPPPPLPCTPGFSSSTISLASSNSIGTPGRASFSGEVESAPDMIDTVRRVFGVDSDRVRQDLEGLRRAGLDDKSYLSDLKTHLIEVNADPNIKQSMILQDRAASLQSELNALLHARPDLVGLEKSSPRGSIHNSGAAAKDYYFTPNHRKDEIYCRLVKQARITLGYETPLEAKTTGERELVELCAGVWGIKNKTVLELGVSFDIWVNCLGQESEEDETVGNRRMMRAQTGRKRVSYTEEFGWAERVLEDMLELVTDARAGLEMDELKSAQSTLTTMHNKVASHITESIQSIYPTTAIPPSVPPPSCFSIIKALHDSSELSSLLPETIKQTFWKDSADDLRGAAVGEYVLKQMELLGADGNAIVISGAETEKSLEGHEKLADFIDQGIKRVGKAWPQDRLDGRLYPPAIILAKQLPLFLAELQSLDQPSSGTKADVIFGLYERTARLIHLWEDFCPDEDLGFELDAFFEPHVREWLKGTNEVDTHEWVTRAVGMDSWVPEGSLRHSQSVLDLFQFIRTAVTTILVDLPLNEYNRACYLIDFSKTAAASVTQYASTVEALFMAEMSPAKANTPSVLESSPSVVSGKAGAWLAKSKQAIQSLDRKKVEGFVIPPTACVKLTDMGAARACLEDLGLAMESEETARVVKEHKLKVHGSQGPAEKTSRYLFTITISRGENLLGKGLSKPADAFVSVSDSSNNTRIFKSNTSISRVDPTWDESFEVGVSGPKIFDVACYDRSLVGKHDLIGTSTIKLDPSAYREDPNRELLLPLNPRGRVHVRVDMEGGEKHEVKFHLDRAGRALDRAAEAMTRRIIDRMDEFIRAQLSINNVKDLLKPLSGKGKKGAVKQMSISDQEYEQSLAPLFDYFDQTFSTFAVTFSEQVKLHTMTELWKRVLETLISLLVPPLSDKETTAEQATPQEINAVFQWLKYLKNFFNACEGGVEHGVPLLTLQAGAYKDLLLIGQYLDLPLPALKEKCVAAIKGVGRGSTKGRAFSTGGFTTTVGNGNSKTDEQEERSAEILLRILRMRPQTSEFLHMQISQLNDARVRKQSIAA